MRKTITIVQKKQSRNYKLNPYLQRKYHFVKIFNIKHQHFSIFEQKFFMKKIQMVDLQSQYNQIQNEVDNSVIDVMSEATFINGPSVKSFQKNLEAYLNVKNVIPCANGTDALQIAMMALDLQPGDEVITTDFTFASTVEVIALLKLTPVLVDIEADTYNIDPQKLKMQ